MSQSLFALNLRFSASGETTDWIPQPGGGRGKDGCVIDTCRIWAGWVTQVPVYQIGFSWILSPMAMCAGECRGMLPLVIVTILLLVFATEGRECKDQNDERGLLSMFFTRIFILQGELNKFLHINFFCY